MITALRKQVHSFDIKNVSLPRREYCITAMALLTLAAVAAAWQVKKFYTYYKIEKEIPECAKEEYRNRSVLNPLFESQENVQLALSNIEKVEKEKREKREELLFSIREFNPVQLHSAKEGDFLRNISLLKKEIGGLYLDFVKEVLGYERLNTVSSEFAKKELVTHWEETLKNLYAKLKKLPEEKILPLEVFEQVRSSSQEVSPVLVRECLDDLKLVFSRFVYKAIGVVQHKFQLKLTGRYEFSPNESVAGLMEQYDAFCESYVNSKKGRNWRGRPESGTTRLINETETEIRLAFSELESQFSELNNNRREALLREIQTLEDELGPTPKQKLSLTIFDKRKEMDFPSVLSKKLFLLVYLGRVSEVNDFLRKEKDHLLFLKNNPWTLLKASGENTKIMETIYRHCKDAILREYQTMDQDNLNEVERIAAHLKIKS